MNTALGHDVIERRISSKLMGREEARLGLLTWDFGNPEADPGCTFVDKLVRKMGWDQTYAERVVEEFRRFVLLWANYPGASHVPSPAVDEAWHFAILFTRRYRKMCKRFFGRYMHHEPSSSPADRSVLRNGYERTLRQYQEVFGELPPADIWTGQQLNANECNQGPNACNRSCETKNCHQGCESNCHFNCEGD